MSAARAIAAEAERRPAAPTAISLPCGSGFGRDAKPCPTGRRPAAPAVTVSVSAVLEAMVRMSPELVPATILTVCPVNPLLGEENFGSGVPVVLRESVRVVAVPDIAASGPNSPPQSEKPFSSEGPLKLLGRLLQKKYSTEVSKVPSAWTAPPGSEETAIRTAAMTPPRKRRRSV